MGGIHLKKESRCKVSVGRADGSETPCACGSALCRQRGRKSGAWPRGWSNGTPDPFCCLRPRSVPSRDRAAGSGTGFQKRRPHPTPEGRSKDAALKHPVHQQSGGCRNLPKPTWGCFCLPETWAEACGAVGGGLEVASPMAKTERVLRTERSPGFAFCLIQLGDLGQGT